MKQLMRVLLVVMMIMAMTVSAFASPLGFVKSVSDKPVPYLLPLGKCPDHGVQSYGWLLDENGNKVQCLHEGQIIVTPLYKFEEGDYHKALTKEVVDLIFQVYEELISDDEVLADVHGLVERIKAELGKHADEDHLSIYELFDVTIIDANGKVFQVPDGYSLMVKFNLQFAMDEFLEVMSYADDHWQLAELVANEGDGVLVRFSHLCPVAFLVESDDAPAGDDDADKPESGDKEDGDKDDEEDVQGGGQDEDKDDAQGGDNAKTGDESNPALWGGLCLAALAGLLGVLKTRKKA